MCRRGGSNRPRLTKRTAGSGPTGGTCFGCQISNTRHGALAALALPDDLAPSQWINASSRVRISPQGHQRTIRDPFWGRDYSWSVWSLQNNLPWILGIYLLLIALLLLQDVHTFSASSTFHRLELLALRDGSCNIVGRDG
jgi:hypothetical protein